MNKLFTPIFFHGHTEIYFLQRYIYQYCSNGYFITCRDITLAVDNGDATGSLLKYDPFTKQVSVLLTGLSGASGVAVSADGTFVLVGELIANRIKRFWIEGPERNTAKTFVEFPGGRVNRIRRTILGEFWVAVNVQISPSSTVTLPNMIKIDSSGDVLETVALDKEYENTRISEVQEHLGKYYIGSRNATVNFVGVYHAI
jgi:strictosidine synthase